MFYTYYSFESDSNFRHIHKHSSPATNRTMGKHTNYFAFRYDMTILMFSLHLFQDGAYST